MADANFPQNLYRLHIDVVDSEFIRWYFEFASAMRCNRSVYKTFFDDKLCAFSLFFLLLEISNTKKTELKIASFFFSWDISRRTYFMWWMAIVSLWQVTMSQLFIDWRLILCVALALCAKIIGARYEMLQLIGKYWCNCYFLQRISTIFSRFTLYFAIFAQIHAAPSNWNGVKHPNP